MMYDLPNKNLDKNCFDNIRIASFTYSKKILESNIRDFENNCYSIVN